MIGDNTARLLGVRSVFLAAVTAALLAPSAASAVTPAAHWLISTTSAPTYFKAGEESAYYEVIAVNDGATGTDGSTVTVQDTLPPGVVATAIRGDGYLNGHGAHHPLTCAAMTCETAGAVRPGEVLQMKIIVTISANASGTLTNRATISGGGTLPANATSTTPVSAEAVPFGASLVTSIAAEGGYDDRQAGSRPFSFTSILAFNVASPGSPELRCPPLPESSGCPTIAGDPKDVNVALPSGLVGNPLAVPRCSQTRFHCASSPPSSTTATRARQPRSRP